MSLETCVQVRAAPANQRRGDGPIIDCCLTLLSLGCQIWPSCLSLTTKRPAAALEEAMMMTR